MVEMIPPVNDWKSLPKGSTCQEASPMSGHRYIPCGADAVAIIAQDARAYHMCKPCAMHNLRNRGAAIIFATDPDLKKMMKEKSIKVVDGPIERQARDKSELGNSTVVEERLPER